MARGNRLFVLIAAALLAAAGCQSGGNTPAGGTAAPPATTGADTGSVPPAGPVTPGTGTGAGTGGPAASTASGPATGSTGLALPAGGPVPVDFRAWSVTWVSNQIGYVLGSGRCSRPPCTSVVRTRDGGQHWVGVPAPVAPLPASATALPPAPAGTVRDLRFATPADGYAFGGGLWTTHDGARTWHKLALGAISDLATDGRTVYAITGNCPAGQPSCGGLRLLASAVGRDDFRPAGVSSSGPAGAPALVSTGAGLVVADLGAKAFVRAGSGAWQPATNPCGVTLVGVLAAASGGAVLGFCGEGAAGSQYVQVRRSTDRGRTWSRATAPVQIRNGLVTATAGSSSLLALAAANPDLGGNLLVSRDGGAHWAAQALARGNGYLYVGARSGVSLVALASPPTGAIWTTSTSGRSWNRLPIR